MRVQGSGSRGFSHSPASGFRSGVAEQKYGAVPRRARFQGSEIVVSLSSRLQSKREEEGPEEHVVQPVGDHDVRVHQVADALQHRLRSGFRVQGPGFRVRVERCMVHGAWCMVHGAWCRVNGAGYRVQGATFRVSGSGFRVQGAGP